MLRSCMNHGSVYCTQGAAFPPTARLQLTNSVGCHGAGLLETEGKPEHVRSASLSPEENIAPADNRRPESNIFCPTSRVAGGVVKRLAPCHQPEY